MPTLAQPQTPPSIDFDQQPFTFSDQPLSSDMARELVVQQFREFESERYKNFDQKWLESDSLYNGIVPTRMWEGSNVPRAAIPNNISFDHVEAAQAFIESALFDNPDWFGVEARRETSPKDARDLETLLMEWFDAPDEEDFSTFRRDFRMTCKSGLMYGTGVGMLEWTSDRPKFIGLDLRDVYVDPGCKTASIDDARSVIVRDEVTVNDLQRFKDHPKIDVPSPSVLYFMSLNKQTTMSEPMEQMRELMRGSIVSVDGRIPFPADYKVEILRYYTKDRIIWILNRMHTMMNDRNPYGFIPLVSFPCRPQIGRFYGSSLPEAIKYQQRVTEALQNVHLDELHQSIEPAVTVPRGTSAKSDNFRIRPGRTEVVDDPSKVMVHQPPGITANVQGDIVYHEQQAERRNGISSLSQGAARPGNINRTKAGVQQQSEGTNSRLKHIISNIEDYAIQPMLYKARKMAQVHTDPDQVLLVPSGEPYRPITARVLHTPVKFKIECASRMLTRDRLGSTLPTLMQTMINGPVIQGLAENNEKIDFHEFAQIVQDSIGTPKKYALVVPMSPEEIESRKQPPPQVVMEAQQKDKDLQIRDKALMLKHTSEMKGHDTEIQKAMIAKQPNPQEQQMKERESQGKMQMMAAQQQQKERGAWMEQQARQRELEMELAFKQQAAQLDDQARKNQMTMDMIMAAQKQESERAKAQISQQQASIDTAAQIDSHQLSLAMQGDQREQQRENHKVKLEQQKQKPNPKAPSGNSRK
jgi:hypothetical protein